jgi:hypothetical protein
MYGNLKIASLDNATVAKISALEEKLGKHIMAFEPGVSLAQLSPKEIVLIEALEKEAGVSLAQLSPKEIEQIEALEKEAGVTLLVYEKLE